MIDEREAFEKSFRRYEPEGGSFERLRHRRDRNRRNQRITAGVVGIAVFVAAIWIVTAAGSFNRTTTPADKPTVNPADTAKGVALGFLDAYAAFDAQKAMTYVADDADLGSLIDVSPAQQFPSNAEALSLRLSLLRAVGVGLTVTSCEAAPIGSDTSVVCDYVFHALGSDQIGRGPFSGSSFVFTVRDGAIVRAGQARNQGKFDRQMWEPFAEWVSSMYPKDAALMYVDGTLEEARFSLESIRLWEQHTREYVETGPVAETGPAKTGPPPARASGAPDVVIRGTCSDGARSQLALTDLGRQILVRFEVHRSPVGHTWRITIGHGGGIMGPNVDRPFDGIRVASDSGDFSVQLHTLDRFPSGVCGTFGECPADSFMARARDTQTGEYCGVHARIG